MCTARTATLQLTFHSNTGENSRRARSRLAAAPQFPSTLEKGLNKLMSLKESFGGMVSQVRCAARRPAAPSARRFRCGASRQRQ